MIRLTLLTFALALTGCYDDATTQEAAGVERQQAQYLAAQPAPFFDYSSERDYVIQLYQLRQSNVATHSVWRSDYGMIEYDCSSIGYGLPYDLQLTNPLARDHYGSYGVVLEQAEPNGLFSSKNTAATWVLCIEDGGSLAPVYIESKVTVFPWPMEVDYSTNTVRKVGRSKARVTKSSK